MLDKSIPYFDVLMVRTKEAPPVMAPNLPPGFSYHMYTPGDAAHWSRVETEVDEFDTQDQAMALFSREFLPHEAELPRRMVFILDADGNAVADAAAWWGEDEHYGKIALLHWVAVSPQVQGRGLGRAVTCKALSLFPQLGPPGDIWLTTQTWSHVAIALYGSLGFCAHKHARILGHKNGYAGALPVLREKMRPEDFEAFARNAIG